MAYFYGSIQGQRGEATRLGSKKSGIQAHIASWSGAVSVCLYEQDGVDMARVTLTTHHGQGCYPAKVLYDGPVSGVAQAVV